VRARRVRSRLTRRSVVVHGSLAFSESGVPHRLEGGLDGLPDRLALALELAVQDLERRAERAEAFVAPAEASAPTVEDKRKRKRRELEGKVDGEDQSGEERRPCRLDQMFRSR